MLDPQQALALAQAWIAAWNRRDLEAILAHYADAIEFTSPRVVSMMGRPDGTLRGRGALGDYFARALATQPQLHFQWVETLVGVDSVTLYYRNHRGQTVAESAWLDASGRVARAWVHYAQAAPAVRP